jgi:hypothetical protein
VSQSTEAPTTLARRSDQMEGDGDEQRAHFTDTEDDLGGVRVRPSQHLTDPTVPVVGGVATFVGRARTDPR